MDIIINNYPTIKNDKNYQKDPRFVRNIFFYLYLIITCNKKRLKKVNNLFDIIDKEFSESMNIYSFIKNREKLLVLENILFNSEDKILINFISQPLLNLEKEKEEKNSNENLDYIEIICIKFNNLKMKQNKTDIEKKLLNHLKV